MWMFSDYDTTIVRDGFALARKMEPAIVFIYELDTIEEKRSKSGGGEREMQRSMLEFLNQMDGFFTDAVVDDIAATN